MRKILSRLAGWSFLLGVLVQPAAGAPPANNACASALPIAFGTTLGTTAEATPDGSAGCAPGGSPDVWFRYSGPRDGVIYVETSGSAVDAVLSVHSGCPDEPNSEIACNTDALGNAAVVGFEPSTAPSVFLRVSTPRGAGSFTLKVGRGGRIAGTVTNAATGDPLAGVAVIALGSDGLPHSSAASSATGTYRTDELRPGLYTAIARNDQGFIDQAYDQQPCPTSCTPTQIAVHVATTTGNIDFPLEVGGRIRGTVSDRATDDPIPETLIRVTGGDPEAPSRAETVTDAAGTYEIKGLVAGTYHAVAESQQFADQLYQDLPCPRAECDVSVGTEVPVAAGETTADIDFQLDRLGQIAGTVNAAAGGQPVAGHGVDVWQETDDIAEIVAQVVSDPQGNYLVGGLTAGDYFVTAQFSPDFLGEAFAEAPCLVVIPGIPVNCYPDSATATAVPVQLDVVTPDIDFTLETMGQVSGRVTDHASGLGIAGARVLLWNGGRFDPVASVLTDAEGRYAVAAFPGRYYVSVASDAHLNEVHDNLPCVGVGCFRPYFGTPVQVDGPVTIDFALDFGGSIAGKVTDFAGKPIPGVRVELYILNSGDPVISAETDFFGRFHVAGLAAGNYFAVARPASGYEPAVYSGLPCPPDGCIPSRGTPIAVTLGQAMSGIDFALPRINPAAGPLILQGGRFRVDIQWEDFEHRQGPGHGVQLSNATGYFWFFNSTNTEVVVKVLNACSLPAFHRFWVFASGLTNVATTMTVTDTWTGAQQIYENPLGQAFQPIQDTRAFATCDAPRPAAPAVVKSTTQLAALGENSQVGCATGMCLQQGRFQVEAEWRTPDGRRGRGHPVLLTHEAGYFWFFSRENVEVVVKVLNACDLEPFHRFWVFAAGLTNVEVLLKVTDTVSGEIREYRNAQGTPFQPVQDLRSFATCDG